MSSLGQLVWHVLRQARWLPAAEAASQAALFSELAPGDDILSLIAAAWSRADPSSGSERHGPERRRGRRLQSWAQDQLASGGRLTIGADGAHHDGFRRWNGHRLVWWPRGIPAGQRVGLVSSHLGRNLNRAHDWFRVFRAACAKVDRHRDVLVTATTTTTDEFVRRAAQLFDLRILLLAPPGKRQAPRHWLDTLARQRRPGQPHSASSCYEAHVSPALDDNLSGALPELVQSPLADRVLMTMSDRLLLFHLRRRGRLLPLVRRRLVDPAWRPETVYVALGPQLVPRDIADGLLAAGAVGWVVFSETNDARPATSDSRERVIASAGGTPVGPESQIIVAPDARDWSYLSHCTRAARGAWPDQAADEFLDELIFSSASADHSALATLNRILDQQEILATSNAIRGGAAMVSFTAAPLDDLATLRTFRVHRGRWDFEPYGICIRREHLQQAGARPVVYGDHTAWNRLARADRPFFQKQFSENAKTGMSIDWSREREWRMLGNVDLTNVDAASALVFVPSIEEAHAVLPHSRWPLVVIPQPGS